MPSMSNNQTAALTAERIISVTVKIMSTAGFITAGAATGLVIAECGWQLVLNCDIFHVDT